MRKLFTYSLFIGAFFMMSSTLFGQNQIDIVSKVQKYSEQKAEVLTKKMDLNDIQKAYAKRAIFDYYQEMYYLKSGRTDLKLTEEKIDNNLYRRVGESPGLTSSQLNEFKSIKEDLIKYDEQTKNEILNTELN